MFWPDRLIVIMSNMYAPKMNYIDVQICKTKDIYNSGKVSLCVLINVLDTTRLIVFVVV